MPELPEVETVRAGVAGAVLGRTVTGVVVRGDRVLRRQVGGTAELRDVVLGGRLAAAARRGKFLWFVLERVDAPPRSLLVHLGMSGQVLVRAGVPPAERRHLRLRLELTGGPPSALDLLDQRTFGYVHAGPLVPTADGLPGGTGSPLAAVPEPVAHIGRDLLDPHLDRDAVLARFGRRRSEVKRVLLDQTVVSGVGNIYADEALWRAGLHPQTSADTLGAREVSALLDAAEGVMRDALAEGGTTFDGLYVDVNGASGYFDRSLAVYGKAGRPCPRCGATVVRSAFMNRSSFTCPRCQRRAR